MGYQYLRMPPRDRHRLPVSARETIGVDLGGTKMLVGVVDSEQKVHHESRESSIGQDRGRDRRGPRPRSSRRRKEARPDVLAAGLGIPATIDRKRGVAIKAVNLEITDVPLRDLMEKRLGLPVFVDNDANVAALAEHLFGAGRGAQNVVMLTIGTGIGGGLVLDGEIYRGSTGAGGRARPHRDRRGRAALPGELPQPRLRRDVRLRAPRSRGRAAARGRARARLGAGTRARATGAITGKTVTEAAHGRRRGRPSRWSPPPAGTSGWRWRASPTSSIPT